MIEIGYRKSSQNNVMIRRCHLDLQEVEICLELLVIWYYSAWLQITKLNEMYPSCVETLYFEGIYDEFQSKISEFSGILVFAFCIRALDIPFSVSDSVDCLFIKEIIWMITLRLLRAYKLHTYVAYIDWFHSFISSVLTKHFIISYT